ncbi:MAG: energy transducer TonB [Dissulfurispiraceae bacterium]|jgi:protein TonB
MANKYIIDNTWRYLPWGFFMSLLIWGTLIGQLTWQAKQPNPIRVELINLPSPASPIIVPKTPVRQATRQQSSPVQQSSKQSSSPTQSPALSTPAVSLSETNLPADNKTMSDTGQAGFENHTIVSVKAAEGPVTPPQFGAAYLNNPKPEYPAFARRVGMEGMVMLKVLVSRTGTPLKIDVAHSSGYEILDKAAAGAVKNWRFAPAKHGDSPVDEWVQVPVAFSLKK